MAAIYQYIATNGAAGADESATRPCQNGGGWTRGSASIRAPGAPLESSMREPMQMIRGAAQKKDNLDT